jgi:hypothetical protein
MDLWNYVSGVVLGAALMNIGWLNSERLTWLIYGYGAAALVRSVVLIARRRNDLRSHGHAERAA